MMKKRVVTWTLLVALTVAVPAFGIFGIPSPEDLLIWFVLRPIMHGNQRAMIANQIEKLQRLVEQLQTARNQLTHVTDSVEGRVGPIADPMADLVAVPTGLINTTRDWHADFTGPAGDMVTSLGELTANGESFSRSWRDVLGAADTADEWAKREEDLLALGPWVELPGGEFQTPWTGAGAKWLNGHGASYSSRAVKGHTDTDELGARLESVNTWYEKDWMNLDPKLRTSCVEGISSFLSLFDMADVAAIFCPKAPPVKDEDGGAQKPRESGEDGGKEDENADGRPPTDKARMRRHLPPLDELIESGKVLALNMPAGSNPALARAIGVFLKNAWLQSLAPAAGTHESGL